MPYTEDEKYMAATLALSRRYWGLSSPNPAVGALVVNHDRVVGQGVHQQPGQPHGEPLALAQAGELAKGATLYVNLEPCNHHGRTPPCTRAILAAGIKRVVYGAGDPNPEAGGGAVFLAAQGLEVLGGVLREKCEHEHRFFLTHQQLKRPHVIMKSAASLDGRIATVDGESQWISSEKARAKTHWLRGRVDALMVGMGTMRADDPRLTCRLPGRHKQPLKVVVDSKLSLSLQAKVLDAPGKCLVACVAADDQVKVKALEQRGAMVWPVGADKHGRVDLAELLKRLGSHDISSLMVEGGGELNFALAENGLLDELWLVLAPMLLGGRNAPSFMGGAGFARLAAGLRFSRPSITRLGDDILLQAMRLRAD